MEAPDECQGGLLTDVSDSFFGQWSSDNTTIATVDTYGNVTGVAAGSTTARTFGTLNNNDDFRNCPLVGYRPSGGVNVAPTITGPNTVWYFNGLSPSGYATSIQLTSSGGSATTWSVTAGANKVNLSSTQGSPITVTSAAQSETANDVSITATAGGETSVPFMLTVRAPYKLGPDPVHLVPVYSQDATYVWNISIYYQMLDNLQTPMPNPISVNENWTSGVVPDFSGENWRRGNPGCGSSSSGSPAEFLDFIQGETSDHTPAPSYNAQQNGTAVYHWGQEFRLGTCQIGSGPRVQTDTLQKYVDHAAHTGITSPAP